jgi:glutamine amidotransferase
MCELLGMSANVPTDICFSFAGLLRRGGDTGPHADGWGLVIYEPAGIREFKESSPSADSETAQRLSQSSIKGNTVIAHIRQANVGSIDLKNTHPFQRELWGETWTFAHNGQVPNLEGITLTSFTPEGNTDSEFLFCWLLGELTKRFDERPADDKEWAKRISHCCATINQRGIFNILLTNGNALFTFCSTSLFWLTRKAPFGVAHLQDDDISMDFSTVTGELDEVTVIATQPLTNNEVWSSMTNGECRLFVEGKTLWSTKTPPVPHKTALIKQ